MRRAFGIIGSILLASYPIGVWMAVSVAGDRRAGVLLLVVLLAFWLPRYRHGGAGVSAMLTAGALGTAVLVLLSILLDDRRFLLATPVLINAGLLARFGSSLLGDRIPEVERFARLLHGDISRARVLYCRSVTKVWCVFFLVNGLVSLGLALFAPLRVWGLYNGGIAYGLIGALFVGEYTVRRIRFG